MRAAASLARPLDPLGSSSIRKTPMYVDVASSRSCATVRPPQHMFIIANSASHDSASLDRVEQTLIDAGVSLNARWVTNASEPFNPKAKFFRIKDLMDARALEHLMWFLHADLDEFPELPRGFATLPDFLDEMASQGFDAVMGRMVDRVSGAITKGRVVSGGLPDLQDYVSPLSFDAMSRLFPLSCDITANVMQGFTTKLVAHTRNVGPVEGGFHFGKLHTERGKGGKE